MTSKSELERFDEFRDRWHSTPGGLGLPEVVAGLEEATRRLCAMVDVMAEELAERGGLADLEQRVARKLAALPATRPGEVQRTAARDRAKLGLALVEEVRSGREGLARVMDVMRAGADRAERLLACEYAGSSGDDELVPIYEQLLGTSRTDAALRAACLTGLIATWLDVPLFRTHSERGYRATIAFLSSLPADELPLDLLFGLGKGLEDPASEWLQGWLARAKWFKPRELRDLLTQAAKRGQPAGPMRDLLDEAVARLDALPHKKRWW